MPDPRRTAIVTPEEDLKILAEITLNDRAQNIPFAGVFCSALTQALLTARPA